MARAEEVRRWEGHHGTDIWLAFSPDGRTLLSAEGARDTITNIRLWDVVTGQKLCMLGKQKDIFKVVAFSPDGRSVVAGDVSNRVYLWEVATGKIRWEVLDGKDRDLFKGCDLKQSGSWITAVYFSPDGSMLVTDGSYIEAGGGHSLTSLWSLSSERTGAAAVGQGA